MSGGDSGSRPPGPARGGGVWGGRPPGPARGGGVWGGRPPGPALGRRLRSFAAFWYDFIIGDDWRGAAVVAAALAGTALLVHGASVDAWWLLPAAVIAALGWSLARAVRRD